MSFPRRAASGPFESFCSHMAIPAPSGRSQTRSLGPAHSGRQRRGVLVPEMEHAPEYSWMATECVCETGTATANSDSSHSGGESLAKMCIDWLSVHGRRAVSDTWHGKQAIEKRRSSSAKAVAHTYGSSLWMRVFSPRVHLWLRSRTSHGAGSDMFALVRQRPRLLANSSANTPCRKFAWSRASWFESVTTNRSGVHRLGLPSAHSFNVSSESTYHPRLARRAAGTGAGPPQTLSFQS